MANFSPVPLEIFTGERRRNVGRNEATERLETRDGDVKKRHERNE